MSEINSFGNPKHFEIRTLDPTPSARPGQLALEPEGVQQLRAIIANLGTEVKAQVVRAYEQWNLKVRDYLRNETGLRLTVGDNRQGVPVSVEDGLPCPLYDLIVDAPDPRAWFLNANRQLIAETRGGLDTVISRLPPEGWKEGPSPLVTGEELARVATYLAWLDETAAKARLEDALKGIDQDILGAYFFSEPKVRIFWMPIGIIARLLQIPVDALTLVVLIHEVAHAYTHLGRDIDGQRWKTGSFARTDLLIVEGLAQFYTGIICERLLREHLPAALIAYERLLSVQSDTYTIHSTWKQEGGSRTGEIVRSAMIGSRTRGVVAYAEFAGLLRESTSQHLGT